MIGRFCSPRLAMLTILSLLGFSSVSQAGWSVGVRFGVRLCHRPCYGPGFGPYFYHPYPVYVAPPPVYVPAVAVVDHAPVAPAASVAPPVPTVARTHGGDVERYNRQLQHPDPRERAEAAVQLGRLRAPGCESSLTALLNNDRSPLVREAAARGLGLLGGTDSLDELQRAASSDEDRDVRRSASYAADVIRASLSRR